MSKILISFLGTGPRKPAESGDVKDDRIPRKYRTANYHVGGEDLGEFSFVSLALHKKFQFDKIFLIGTAHSMWEEVYNQFRSMSDGDYDQDNPDDVYYELLEACDANDHTAPLAIPHKEQVEAAMPKGSKAVLIKYGLSEEEIKENSNIVLSLADDIRSNDELFVDVTHSFRSLPLIVMQLILYLRTVKPGTKINHIFYGMLDITSEMQYTPIVDLKSLLTVNDWISGAYAFKEFGNAYKIAELLKQNHAADSAHNSAATVLEDFSNAMNLNATHLIKNETARLASVKIDPEKDRLESLIINPLIDGFTRQFQNKTTAKFQYELSKWHLQHKNYLAAYVNCYEALISLVWENNQKWITKHSYFKDDDNKLLFINDETQRNSRILQRERDYVKGWIRGKSCPGNIRISKEVTESFSLLQKDRNALVHLLKEEASNSKSLIRNIKDAIEKVKKEF